MDAILTLMGNAGQLAHVTTSPHDDAPRAARPRVSKKRFCEWLSGDVLMGLLGLEPAFSCACASPQLAAARRRSSPQLATATARLSTARFAARVCVRGVVS